MGIVAIAGDATTTTAVALASAWPAADDTVLVEADPEGGDVAAWFDMPVAPSLSTVVTRLLDGSWSDIEQHTRLAAPGLRVVPAPSRAGEAARALGESARSLVPALASLPSPITIADTGGLQPTPSDHPFVAASAVTVVVHRQAAQSARAAAVRLQRLADHLDAFAGSPSALVVAIVGAAPFDLGEIETFLAESVGTTPLVGLPVDDLAAAVVAGRTGVSARRLARLPLLRASRDLAAAVGRSLQPNVDDLWRSAP